MKTRSADGAHRLEALAALDEPAGSSRRDQRGGSSTKVLQLLYRKPVGLYAEGVGAPGPGSRSAPRGERLALCTPKALERVAQGRGSAPWESDHALLLSTPKALERLVPT